MSNDLTNDKYADSSPNELSRQLTLQLSKEQYERLFFQPTAAKGDLAKVLGTSPSPNPTSGYLFSWVIFFKIPSQTDNEIQVIRPCSAF